MGWSFEPNYSVSKYTVPGQLDKLGVPMTQSIFQSLKDLDDMTSGYIFRWRPAIYIVGYIGKPS